MGNQNIESSLVEVIADKGFFDILSDVGEIIIDDSLTEGVYKDIPIIGSIIKLYKSGVGIKGYVFVKKLNKFLTSLKDIPTKQREDFINKMNNDLKFKEKIGESLILILDRLDSLDKPDYIAKAFKAYMKERINFESFQRISSAIDRCFLPDLLLLKDPEGPSNFSSDTILNLSSAGLLEIKGMPSIHYPGAKNDY
jgi:hypothetical protein